MYFLNLITPFSKPTYLKCQAGKQLEYLTGGYVVAGFHEVVVSAATTRVISENKASSRSLWRISSTFFGHIQSDQILEPIGRFKNPESLNAYPSILAGDQVPLSSTQFFLIYTSMFFQLHASHLHSITIHRITS